MSVELEWLATPLLEQQNEQMLGKYQAFWAVPATPYASMEGALNGFKFAREQRVPFLGTCGGYQHMIIEYARNVLGLTGANHAESNPAVLTPANCRFA
jgi:CTP synthase (UTP-ammonia lyase)